MQKKLSAFQTPITISEVVDEINHKKYLLPAIQREFVWKPEQIIKLFDSILRGYPIGSFLFWNIEEEKMKEFQFYEFICNYHERDNKHNAKVNVKANNNPIVVLDGQQRLTALYIGLMGTYAAKISGKQWKNDDAFPKRKLYLNLLLEEKDNEDLKYNFAFLTDDEAKERNDSKYWFHVGAILSIIEESEVNDYLVENGLMKMEDNVSKFANSTLFKLHSVIHKDTIINYYLEHSQELDKVLNIFIRVNNGGTQLSYSDLLLSIATTQWKNKDAREEMTSFVDEINKIGDGFEFNKDFILKSCLILSDISAIAFKVDNFSKDNMTIIEKEWDKIKKSIKLAVLLVSEFGYTQKTLTSANAIIPIAYYYMKIDMPDTSIFLKSSKYQEDRMKIKKWLAMSLTKRVFSGHPDNILKPIRTIMQSKINSFPIEKIIEEFKGTPKSILFSNDDIDNLFNAKYSQNYTFSILALLYPTLDYNNRFHQDHIFPRSWFDIKTLSAKNIPNEKHDYYLNTVDSIANLQLLEGLPNQEKSSKDFDQWLGETYKTEDDRRDYMKKHYIPEGISLQFNNFEEFINKRKELLKAKFKKELQLNLTDKKPSKSIYE